VPAAPPSSHSIGCCAKILGASADSAYGRRHGFGDISTFRQFQERVPIATYEDLEPSIKAAMLGEPNQLTTHSPVLFTTTSGTTGARKYIPMTRVRARLPHHAQAHPVDVHGALCGVLC
jgi:hypothetical protein